MHLLNAGDNFEILALEHQRILTTPPEKLNPDDFWGITDLLARCAEKVETKKQFEMVTRVGAVLRNKLIAFRNYCEYQQSIKYQITDLDRILMNQMAKEFGFHLDL